MYLEHWKARKNFWAPDEIIRRRSLILRQIDFAYFSESIKDGIQCSLSNLLKWVNYEITILNSKIKAHFKGERRHRWIVKRVAMYVQFSLSVFHKSLYLRSQSGDKCIGHESKDFAILLRWWFLVWVHDKPNIMQMWPSVGKRILTIFNTKVSFSIAPYSSLG